MAVKRDHDQHILLKLEPTKIQSNLNLGHTPIHTFISPTLLQCYDALEAAYATRVCTHAGRACGASTAPAAHLLINL